MCVCGLAVCGRTRLGEAEKSDIYAGMLPLKYDESITVALTPLPGGPADPRQDYATAYDNPSFILHIIGENLVNLDRVAQDIRAGADRTSHIETEHGTINTLAVGPPRRIIRSDRPRYDVQMQVDAEIIRTYPTPPAICNLAVCGLTPLGKAI